MNIFSNQKRTNIKGKKRRNHNSSHVHIYIYIYIYRQCTWVPSCANMCIVSCHRLQLIDCFSVSPKSDLFYCFLFFCGIMFTDNFSFASFIDTTVHVMRTYTYIYIYRQSCLSSVVEMIIINDHGSLVVCC